MEILSSYRDISGRIWLLAMVNFINRCGGMIMCFLSLYITESLHYKLTTAGIAMSFYGIGAVFGQQVGGYLSDKIGYQRVQLWSLMGTGIMILVLMQVRNFYLLCFVLFIQNLVSEAFRPANSVAITANSDLSTRTRSFSLLRVAFNLAITIALSVGGWLITKGWNYVFWVDSFTCFASALTLYFFVPEVHRITKEQRRENKLIVANNASPYKDKTYMRFIFASFLGALAFMQIIWTIPPFFKNVYHWNESQIGLISALNGAVVMLIELPMVSKLEKMMSKLKIIKIGLLVYGLSYLTLTISPSLAILAAIAYMVFISIGEIFVMPFSTSWATSYAPKMQEGKYMSMYGISYAVANIVAPLCGTQIIERFGYNVLWVTIACISLIAAFTLLSVKDVEVETANLYKVSN